MTPLPPEPVASLCFSLPLGLAEGARSGGLPCCRDESTWDKAPRGDIPSPVESPPAYALDRHRSNLEDLPTGRFGFPSDPSVDGGPEIHSLWLTISYSLSL